MTHGLSVPCLSAIYDALVITIPPPVTVLSPRHEPLIVMKARCITTNNSLHQARPARDSHKRVERRNTEDNRERSRLRQQCVTLLHPRGKTRAATAALSVCCFTEVKCHSPHNPATAANSAVGNVHLITSPRANKIQGLFFSTQAG